MNFFQVGELNAEFGSVVFKFFTILIHFRQKSSFFRNPVFLQIPCPLEKLWILHAHGEAMRILANISVSGGKTAVSIESVCRKVKEGGNQNVEP